MGSGGPFGAKTALSLRAVAPPGKLHLRHNPREIGVLGRQRRPGDGPRAQFLVGAGESGHKLARAPPVGQTGFGVPCAEAIHGQRRQVSGANSSLEGVTMADGPSQHQRASSRQGAQGFELPEGEGAAPSVASGDCEPRYDDHQDRLTPQVFPGGPAPGIAGEVGHIQPR